MAVALVIWLGFLSLTGSAMYILGIGDARTLVVAFVSLCLAIGTLAGGLDW